MRGDDTAGMPSTTAGRRYPFLDHPGPIPFAHRGGAGDFPENTMPAFRAAVALGYRYLETDVHATADGVLVAFHDDDLSRTCGRPGFIHELPWSEVETARVDGTEPIPLLVDLLEEFPEARLNVDCKHETAVDPLIAMIRRTGCVDRMCVGSFTRSHLRAVRRGVGARLCTSFHPYEVARWLAASCLPGTWPTPKDVPCAQVPVRRGAIPVTTRRTVAEAHRAGVQVHVWTIDDAEEMHRLLDLGVDGLMSDHPAVLKDVLTARGQWA
jgi:glycerophosphoryl diester phosphodiesterase